MDVNIKRKAFKEIVFKAYDIRGLYPEELDHNTIELIAAAFAEYLKLNGGLPAQAGTNCVVGEDIRWSSPEISEIVKKELLDRGVDVIDIGQTTTPLNLFSLAQTKASGGIMVTASHNTIRFNGLKIYKGLESLSQTSGLPELSKMIKEGKPEYSGPRGKLVKKSFLQEYVDFLSKEIKVKRKLKAVFDTGGGAVGLVLPKILQKIKYLDAETLFLEIDPSLSKREPNPLLPQAQEKIREAVVKNRADVGFLFDPDGDRVIVFDEKGEAIRGDGILWLLARRLIHSGESIVYDIRSSRSVVEDLEAESIKCFKSRVGHSFVQEQMRIENAALGGELSGHYYFKDFFYSESTVLAFLKILQIVSSSKNPLSEIMKPFFRYNHSGEINFVASDKAGILTALEKKYLDADRDYFEGVTFRYPDWWFNIRPSHTENLLRMVLEAKNKEIFHDKKDEVLATIFSKGAKLA